MAVVLMSRPGTIGEVLDSMFRITRATIVPLIPLSLLANVLLGAYMAGLLYIMIGAGAGSMFSFGAGQAAPQDVFAFSGRLMGAVGSLMAVFFVLYMTIYAAQQYIALKVAQGEPRPSGAMLYGLSRVLPMIGASLAVGFAFALLFGGTLALLIVVGRASPAIAVLLGIGWFVALMVGALRLSMTHVEVVLGRAGVFDAISSSWAITKGNLMRLTAVATVGILVVVIFDFVVELILFYPASLLSDALSVPPLLRGQIVGILARLLTGVITLPLTIAGIMAVWNDLHLRASGGDIGRQIDALTGGP